MMVLAAFIGGMFLGGFLGILIASLAVAAGRKETPPKGTLTPEQHQMITDAFKKGQQDGNNVRVLRQEDPSEG
jgi:hypothetical protein